MTDIEQTYINQRLRRLEEHDHVANLARGLWELVDDPRDDRERDQDDVDEHLQERVRELQEQLADCRAERDRLQERVDELEARDDRDLDRDALRRAADSLEAACERGDGAAVQDALDRIREEIDR